MTERIWYGTFFDTIHCDTITNEGKPCRMVPAYEERETRRKVCYIHIKPRFEQLKKERERA